MTQLGAGSEFDLIRALAARWGSLAIGLGDDAAILDVPRGERMVASVDASVEGVHFRRDWLSLTAIGYRATTAALSDLAAMAARPLGVLVAFTVPAPRRRELLEVADGIGEAVRVAQTVIRGGNLSAGEALTITTTVIGSAFQPLARTGARVGDAIWVTGRLGGPALAISALRDGQAAAPRARDRLVRPVARLREARWLATAGVVAAIDVSDGLAGDAAHLAAASGVGIEIEVDRVPLVDGARADDVLASGEEYELLCVSRAPLDDGAFAAAFGIPLTRIGRVVPATRTPVVFLRGGTQIEGPMITGHDHFRP